MGQNLDKIEAMYDELAGEWSQAFAREHDKKPKDQEVLLRFARELEGRGPVWDFACGPGNTTKYLRDAGLEISGLDLSEKMIGQAQKSHPGIHFRKGNILDLDFEDDSIAGVVAFYAIVHFSKEQVRTMFEEVFRVLVPEGIFLLTFHVGQDTIHLDEFFGKKIDIDFMFFTSGFVSDSLKKSGFEKIEAIEREPCPEIEFKSRRAYVFAKKPLR